MSNVAAADDRMVNITLSAKRSAIACARELARENKKSLNQEFQEWLDERNREKGAMAVQRMRKITNQIGTFKIGKIPSREERNGRY